MSEVADFGKSLFGGGSSPGMMGTGRFQGQAYQIDPKAFSPDGLNSNKQEQEARGQQADFVKALNAQMRGEGPSLAQGQLQDATDRNIAQSMAMAASQRGVNPALAARMSMQNAAGINQQAASDSALIRSQEQLNAQGLLGSNLQGMRQGDLAATDRDLSAKMGKEQLSVNQQTGLNSINQQGYDSSAKRRGDLISNIGGGIAAAMSDEDVKTSIEDGAGKTKTFLDKLSSEMNSRNRASEQEKASSVAQNQQDIGKLLGKGMSMLASGGGAGAGAGAGAAAASDEKNKKSESGGDKKIQGFLDALKAHSYEYKDDMKGSPLGGEGEFVSPMAQDIEKTEVGKSMVIDTPEGKVVDYGKGFGAILAAQAVLNERLKKIEGKAG